MADLAEHQQHRSPARVVGQALRTVRDTICRIEPIIPDVGTA